MHVSMCLLIYVVNYKFITNKISRLGNFVSFCNNGHNIQIPKYTIHCII